MIYRSITRVLVGLVALMVAVFSMGAIAWAEPDAELTPEKIDLIRQRCSSLQFALQQIEKRDAVSRINRGRDYDQMLRQVSALNSRFAYNKLSVPDLIQLTNDLQSAVDRFRADYDKYDTDLSDAAKIDCKTKPIDYYTIIQRARDDRTMVGDQVKVVNDLMGQYRAAVVNYRSAQ